MSDCAHRFWSKVDKRGPDECWEWQAYRRRLGYGEFRIGPRVGGRAHLAHRVAWELTRGPIPDGMQACHRCDNPPCVNPAHLFLGTANDNIQDMIRKGRKRLPDKPARGSGHGMAKLTEQQVYEIRHSEGDQRECARRYGVSQGTVHLIRAGKIWRHVA